MPEVSAIEFVAISLAIASIDSTALLVSYCVVSDSRMYSVVVFSSTLSTEFDSMAFAVLFECVKTIVAFVAV